MAITLPWYGRNKSSNLLVGLDKPFVAKWLRQETFNLKILGSNPSGGTMMHNGMMTYLVAKVMIEDKHRNNTGVWLSGLKRSPAKRLFGGSNPSAPSLLDKKIDR